jgi:hypothetical protein
MSKQRQIQTYITDDVWRRAEIARRHLEKEYGVDVSWSAYMNKVLTSWLERYEANPTTVSLP